jgi:hypothetical protein
MAISTDFSLPTFLERAKTAALTMPVYAGGSTPTAPSAGTFTLYDGSKVVVVTGAVTVTGNVATYTVAAASIPSTTSLSDAWQEEWALTVDGVTETIRRDCYLCLRSLYNVVNEAMLLRRVTDLNNLKPASIVNFQGYMDEAWASVQGRLLHDGRYQAKAAEHREAADRAFTMLRLEYDESQSNQRAGAVDSVAAVPVIYTNTPRWGVLGGGVGWPRG